MNPRNPLWGRLLLAVAGTALMLFCALSVLSSGYVDGEFVPQNADAFYHARRILDAVMSGQPVIQFDPLMHVPEGSWITWPWGYDQALAWTVSLFGPFATEQEAARVLFLIPLAAIPAAIGLMVWLTWQLRLSLGMSALAVLSYAAMPYMFMHYAAGNVDHHFAEQLWVLMSLNGAVWLLRCPASRTAPVFLGVVLGTGIAIQNGLFLLPVLVVLALALAWLRDLPLPDRGRLDTLAVSLLAASVAVCVPSQPWRNGEFGYLELSWFQTYVAAACAVYVSWMARTRPSPRIVALMAAAGVVSLAVAYVPVVSGLGFASGKSATIQNIAEAISPYSAVSRLGPDRSIRLFTWLMWLSLPALLLNAWWASRSRRSELVIFAAIGVVLLMLMQSQIRFAVMGMMSLIITLPLAAEELASRRPESAKIPRLAVVLAVAVCYLPTKGFFRTVWVPGNDHSYAALRPALQQLGKACAENPGTVVATMNAGHWIRYHTDCAVIANLFILSPRQIEKLRELDGLLELTPEQLRDARPDIRYVLVHINVAAALRAGLVEPSDAEIQTLLPQERRLVRELLRTDRPIPPGYRQISTASTGKGGVYARVLEILR